MLAWDTILNKKLSGFIPGLHFQIDEKMSYRLCTSMQTIFVIKNLKVNLLCLPALTSLNIVKRVDSVETQGSDIKKKSSLECSKD